MKREQTVHNMNSGAQKVKESESTEKKIHCIKDSFAYCINSAVISCLHTKKDNFRLLQDFRLVPLPTGGKTGPY